MPESVMVAVTPARHAVLLLACLIGGALVSVGMGQDANWDLLNYHLYNGAAWVGGRFDADLLAAGLQTYLNPLLDASYAGLALGPLKLHPRWLAAVMGLWYGGLVYFAARLAVLLNGASWGAVAGVGLAVTGVAVVSQVGTTTGEVQAGVVMAAGLFVLWRQAEVGAAGPVALGGAGVLFGVAAGLKLTAVVYGPAGCLAAVSLFPRRRMFGAGLLFAGGWLAGFGVVDGWWAVRVYERFSSPVFPMLNGVFRSGWYPPASLVDDRFFPRGWVEWLFYPLFWREGGVTPSELPFRDYRAAVTLCLGYGAVLVGVLGGRPGFTRVQRAALVFLGVGYVSWLGSSSILRYAVILEVVAGVMLPVLLRAVLPGRVAVVGAVVVGVVLSTTRYPRTERVAYGAEILQATMDWVEPGTLIVLTFRGPVAHLAALMPERAGVSVLNVGDTVLEARGWPLHDAVVRRIREHRGRIVVITAGNPERPFPELGEVGLDANLRECRVIGSSLWPVAGGDLHACEGVRVGVRVLRSPFWGQAAARYGTVVQLGDTSSPLIGAAYLAATGARGTRFMDWTDLLWSGVGKAGSLPAHLDSGTLYVVSPEFVPAMIGRVAAGDVLGRVDGFLVVAPGWWDCAACTAPVEGVADVGGGLLTVGGFRRLGPEDRVAGVLASGWWAGDPVSVWSGAEAEMVLRVGADVPEGARLVIEGKVLTGPGLAGQRVVAEVEGHPESAVTQAMAGAGEVEVGFRRDWLVAGGDGALLLRVRLRLPDSASPADIGLSVDPRRLGFSPTVVRLEAR